MVSYLPLDYGVAWCLALSEDVLEELINHRHFICSSTKLC